MSEIVVPEKKKIRFSEALKNVFDSLLGEPINFTTESIRASQGLNKDVENLSEYDVSLEVEKLKAIKQSTSKGFRVLDINPNLLTREEYYCAYQDDVLRQYVGNENVIEDITIKFDNIGTPIAQQNIQSPYWRTIEIPVDGDFLKIEFLPIRQNAYTNVGITPMYLTPNVEPQNTTAEVNGAYLIAPEIASTDIILVDFENPSQTPLIAKNGQVYKTYFTSVFLTFKQLSPLIRVTVGVGSEIIDPENNVKGLALWDGKSFVGSSLQAPKQFCITDKDFIIGSGLRGIDVRSLTLLTSNLQEIVTNEKIIGTTGGVTVNQGLSVLWLTELSAQLVSDRIIGSAAAGIAMNCDVELFVVNTTNRPTLNLLERLASVNVNLHISAGSCDAQKTTCTFNEPVRVSLKADQSLYVRILPLTRTNTDNFPIYLKFNLNGYSHGNLQSLFAIGVNQAPYRTTKLLTENPYPTDLERYGSPNV